jgi:hypothetical protein
MRQAGRSNYLAAKANPSDAALLIGTCTADSLVYHMKEIRGDN